MPTTSTTFSAESGSKALPDSKMSMYAARGWADGFNTVLFIGIQPEFNNYFFTFDSSAIISFVTIQAT
jgi:hypothetical protein